tara:strand:+ start:28859 stop:29404 length:546 start_codon:yes stop_codon:yes gene_type:complete
MNNRRKIKYVDRNIQGSLMVLLITLEVIMILVALIYIYTSFNQIFEDSIYQIHKSNQEPFYQQFLIVIFWVVIIMSVINFIALIIANAFWLKHINKILTFLTKTMSAIKNLSLKFPSVENVPQHDLTKQLILWQNNEIERAKTTNKLISALPQTIDELDEKSLTESLSKLQQQLRFASFKN